MLDDILEFVLEIVIEGMFEATSSSRVPTVVRFLLGAVLGIFYLGLFGLLFAVGVKSGSGLLIVIDLVLFVGLGVIIYRKSKAHQKHTE